MNQEPRFPEKSWDESWFLGDGGVLIKTGPVLIKTPWGWGERAHEPRTKIPRKVIPGVFSGTKIRPKTVLGILVLGSWFQAF